jgi:hypothetical protein
MLSTSADEQQAKNYSRQAFQRLSEYRHLISGFSPTFTVVSIIQHWLSDSVYSLQARVLSHSGFTQLN